MLPLLAVPAPVEVETVEVAAAVVVEARLDRVNPVLHRAAAAAAVVEEVVARELLVPRLPLPTAVPWLRKPSRSAPRPASPPRPLMLAAT